MPNDQKHRQIGLVLFDDAEELDFVGPFEVFTMVNEVFGHLGDEARHDVLLISESGKPVRGAKGMEIAVTHSFADAPQLDILLIPGGNGTRREETNQPMLDFLNAQAKGAEWVTSVCTGSLVLGAAGLTEGKRVTTHWAFIPDLKKRGYAGDVLEAIRYVRDGNLVTSAGVSAGIDMALWLTGQIYGPDHARLTQKAMEYDPAPPYTAAV